MAMYADAVLASGTGEPEVSLWGAGGTVSPWPFDLRAVSV